MKRKLIGWLALFGLGTLGFIFTAIFSPILVLFMWKDRNNWKPFYRRATITADDIKGAKA